MKRFLPLAALAWAAACSKGGDAETHEQPVVGAAVEKIVPQRFLETADAIGAVVSRAGHVASLAAPAPTRVAGVNVITGAHVHAGDVLVRLDQAPFESAVKSADAALAAAQSAYDRALRLADAGVSPRKDAEQAAAALAEARSTAATAHHTLELAALRSPIDGVVTRMSAVLSASVDTGQPLVDITDTSVLDVTLTLSVSDAGRVAVGQQVALHAGSDSSSAVIATGRVADVSGTVDSASLGVAARVEIVSGAKSVRIGQTLFGRVAVAEHQNAIVIKPESLVPNDEGFKVFVVDDSGMALSRPVTVGGRSDRGVWIKEGLKAGETVVTRGAYGVSDSAKVDTKGGAKDVASDSGPGAKPVATKPATRKGGS